MLKNRKTNTWLMAQYFHKKKKKIIVLRSVKHNRLFKKLLKDNGKL